MNSATTGEAATARAATAPAGASKRVSKQGFDDFLRTRFGASAELAARPAVEPGPVRLPRSADWVVCEVGAEPGRLGEFGLRNDSGRGSAGAAREGDASGLGSTELGETTTAVLSDSEGSAGALWQGADPLLRVLATTAPVAPMPAPSSAPVPTQTLDAIAQQLIKRLSVGKTASGGAVRLELGAGPYAGTGILLTNDGSRVGVGLDGDGDAQSQQLVSRLVERLRARGMDAHVS